MQIELGEFCHELTEALNRTADALDTAVEKLRSSDTLAPMLGKLTQTQHRLKLVSDRANQQHAYLLIFGPLKSGKSTLMNAISGAYVSEVSSLPAYPCLVYLHEGSEKQFSLSSFEGKSEAFDSSGALKERIEGAHQELADEIRRFDRDDREFSPERDFPQGIRRVDITLPAPNLQSSGTILVDTPGLYAKMKYDYDQLTRDFRNNAACAVFVVKTDNLFYEKVFEEFGELLEIFSRVFLVVNIDSSKQDLGADGRLEPSLESRNPREVVRAFESLTVNAPLRRAIESGSLQIYLIDLLQTAARTLREQQSPLPPQVSIVSGPSSSPVNPVFADSTDEAKPGPKLGFDVFLKDLTDYLNSSDYIVEFISDSLRQADAVTAEVREEIETDTVERLRTETADLKQAINHTRSQLATAQSLKGHDLAPVLSGFAERVGPEARAGNEEALDQLRTKLDAAVDRWFEQDSSLADLADKEINPAIGSVYEASARRAREAIEHHGQKTRGGFEFDPDFVQGMEKLGLSLEDLFATFPADLTESFRTAASPPDIDLKQSEFPVKKGILDWLLFRSEDSIRERVFGETRPSTKELTVAEKQKRLGDDGRAHLKERVEDHLKSLLPGPAEESLTRVLDDYRAHCRKLVEERLESKRSQLARDLARDEERCRSQEDLIQAIEELSGEIGGLESRTAELRKRHVGAKPQGEKEAEAEALEEPEDVEMVSEAEIDELLGGGASTARVEDKPEDKPAGEEGDQDDPGSGDSDEAASGENGDAPARFDEESGGASESELPSIEENSGQDPGPDEKVSSTEGEGSNAEVKEEGSLPKD